MESDRALFRQGDESDRVATFLNQVFRNYRESARASVERHLREEYQRFIAYLNSREAKDHSASLALARQALQDYSQQKRAKEVVAVTENFTVHGPHYTFRIDNENAAYLTGETCKRGPCVESCHEEQTYRLWTKARDSKNPELKAMSAYVRAVFEEYARLPYTERERIYYRKIIHDAESHSKNQGLRVIMQNGSVWIMRPLGFRSDPATLYNYLVGYAVSLSSAKSAAKPLSIRLSRILAVVPCMLTHASLSAEERSVLMQQMKERGVAYLVGDCADIEVLFTPEGMNMYRAIQWNRPAMQSCTSEKSYRVRCHFWCTEFQAFNYFRLFGADAEVLAPPTLQRKLQGFYKDGAALYGQV